MLHVTLFMLGRPRGSKSPGYYHVNVGGNLIGVLKKYADLGTTKHRWSAYRWVNHKQVHVGSFYDTEKAVRALLAEEGLDAGQPLTITKDHGYVSFSDVGLPKRDFDFLSAYYLGDDEDGVFILPEHDAATGAWFVLTVVGSETIGYDFALAYKGPYATRQAAAEAGLQTGLDWIPGRGIMVDNKDVDAIREDINSRSIER